jgi:hypothetical protein
MRKFLFLLWLLLPVTALAYHYGPGQERMTLDTVAHILAEADQHATRKEWQEAIGKYDAALQRLPAERKAEARRIRLERAKAQMLTAQLPKAHEELEALVDELAADKNAESNVLTEGREALASAKYYMTWLLRLEGHSREVWEPEIESSRQLYRLLAEQAANSGDAKLVARRQEDLESAIRLARLDLNDLQGYPLPSQCKNCKSGKKGAGRSQKGQARRPGEEKPEDARSAGSGPPPDGKGS